MQGTGVGQKYIYETNTRLQNKMTQESDRSKAILEPSLE